MLRTFKRKAAPSAPVGLPSDVQALIEGATVHIRPDSEDKSRAMIFWPGQANAAWHHTPEATETRIRAMFPELDGDQVARACRALAARVQIAQRELATVGRANAGPRFSDWRPAPRIGI